MIKRSTLKKIATQAIPIVRDVCASLYIEPASAFDTKSAAERLIPMVTPSLLDCFYPHEVE
jgi:hypothetical protein